MTTTDFELERRAQVDSFQFIGIIVAGGFTVTATQTCPQVVFSENYPEPNTGKRISNMLTCGVSAVLVVTSAFTVGFHKSG